MRRSFLLLIILFLNATLFGQALRINEIARAYELPVALQHISLEMYNAGSKALNMKGMRFFVNGRSQSIEYDAHIPAKGFLVFNFAKKNGDAPEDLDLKLPWQGATIMLWDANDERLLDMFIYSELPDRGSFGRCPDGAVKPAYTDAPSIGRSCDIKEVSEARSASVQVTRNDSQNGITISLQANADAIYYSLDGSEPKENSLHYEAPILMTGVGKSIIKARSFSAGEHPSEVLVEAVIPAGPARRVVAISLHEEDLWDEEKGIYTKGSKANYSRKGKAWERTAIVQTKELNSKEWKKQEFGVRISGSGTRSLNKRSFKLFRRARYGDGPLDFFTALDVDEVVIRADGTPNSFLRNSFIEQLGLRAADQLDVQRSRAMDLYLNGEYWGAYRAMPAKDPMWIEAKHKLAGIDMLAGSAYRVVSGGDRGLDELLDLFSHKHLSSDQLQRLEELIEVESLIQLAVLDVYTGRADHELNTRMWRPAGGKWRWILYDFDLWALASDPSLDRMLFEPDPVPPFIGTIWETPQLQARFLSYMCALLNSELHPVQADGTIREIYDAHRVLLKDDHTHWQYLLDMMDPELGLQEMRQKLIERPAHLFKQLADRSGRELLAIPYRDANGGQVRLDGLAIAEACKEIKGWSGVLVLLEAFPDTGMEFHAWKGIDQDSPLILVELDKIEKVEAVFRKKQTAKP